MNSRAVGIMRTPDWTVLSGSQRRIAAKEKQSALIERLVVQRRQKSMPIGEQGLEAAALGRQYHGGLKEWNAELAAADRPAL
jgi:hypothetical protein